MKKIGLSLATLYSDLAQSVQTRVFRPGSIFRMKVKGREYVYVKRLVGTARLTDYLGSVDDPATEAKVELVRQSQELARQDRETIRLLIRSGIPAPGRQLGRVLDALSDAGIFDDTVLVGTAAYQCYSPMVGYILPHPALMTGDADLAAAHLAMKSLPGGETLLDVLRRAEPSFAPVPALSRPTAPPSSFKAKDGFRVDLVTQQRTRRDQNPLPVKGLGAGAAPLQFIRWLITDPVPAVVLHGTGVAVRVPQPARFAMHKLILAQERRDDQRAKRQKDLMQARGLVEALQESDPYALADAHRDATRQGKPGWARRIDRSLDELELSLGEG